MSCEPVVSIIISSHNRADDLDATLRSLAECRVPTDLPTEVLLIDNASTDRTPALLASWQMNHMEFRPLREPRPGKSGALNWALGQARGQILLFTDDDVRFPTNWLIEMCRPILDGQTDAVIGGIRLASHLERPWLTGMKRSWLAITDHYDDSATIMIGANMAMTRRVFEQLGGFDTDLGPGGAGGWVAGDDVLLSYQVREAGFRIMPRLQIQVEHHLQANRLSRATFVRRAFLEGQQEAYIYHHWLHGKVRLARFKKWVRQGQLAVLRLLRRQEVLQPEGAADWELNLLKQIGFLQQYPRESRRPRHYPKRGLVPCAAVGPLLQPLPRPVMEVA